MKKAVVTLTAILSFISFIIPVIGALAGSVFGPEAITAGMKQTANALATETPAVFKPTSSSNITAGALLIPSPLETLTMKITAYTSLPDETDSTPFITANGTYVHDGIVATNILPFGTRIEIPALFGNKVFVVEDRMNSVFKNNVDIWMPTKIAALIFGAHWNVKVIVLPPNTEITEK